MRNGARFCAGPVLTLAVGLGLAVGDPASAATGEDRGLPFAFVPNAGQLAPRFAFEARGANAGFAFGRRHAMLVLGRERPVALALRFVGARRHAPLVARSRSPVTFNYLRGRDPRRWQRGLTGFRRLTYRSLWRGVDLRFRGSRERLKYELRLAPGARIGAVRMAYGGARSLALDRSGDLLVRTARGVVRDERPVAYQRIRGRYVAVPSRFRLLGGTRYGFTVGAYDRRHPLVIDPGLAYATLLGGNGLDEANGIAVDGQGNAYVTGSAQSANFPSTPGAFDPEFAAANDAFVVKLSPSGASASYATFLGGTGNDLGRAIAVDAAGSAYVTGQTDSVGFPATAGAFDTTNNSSEDAFVTKLTPAGDGVVYSTFLGGTSSDDGRAIVIDGTGSAYIAGAANSSNFPTAGAIDSSYGGGADAFVAQLNAAGSALTYSTYLGGTQLDYANAIAVRDGAAYITGVTWSTHAFGTGPADSYPVTAGALDTLGAGQADAFATKVAAGGASLAYSTLLGGGLLDIGNGIAVDGSGTAYVVGSATPGFPTTVTAYDTMVGGNQDAFVTRLSSTGSAALYSTFLGSSSDTEAANAVALDANGRATVTGVTDFSDFPTTGDRLQGWSGGQDAFLTTLTSDGSGLAFSTFLGTGATDVGRAIATDATGAYVAGISDGSFLTTAGAFQTTPGGSRDGFVVKVGTPLADPPPGDGNSGGGGGPGGDGGGGAGGEAPGGTPLAARFTGPARTTGLGLTLLDAHESTGADRYLWDLNGDGRDDIGCGADQPLVSGRLAAAATGLRSAAVGTVGVRLTAVRADGLTATTSQAIQVATSPAAQRATDRIAQPLACVSDRTTVVLRRPCENSKVEFGFVSVQGCFERVSSRGEVPAGERAIVDAAIAWFNENQRRRQYIFEACRELFHRDCIRKEGEITRKEADPLLETTDLRIARSRVKVNGLEVIPQAGGTIAVFPQIGRIISSNAIVKLGDTTIPISRQLNLDVEGSGPLYSNPFRPGGRLTIFSFRPSVPFVDLAGFGIDGEVRLDLVDGGVRKYSEAAFRLALPDAFGVFDGQPPSGSVVLRVDNDHPVALDDVDVRVPYAELAGLKFRDVRFHYAARGAEGCAAKLWKATATVYLGIEDGDAGFRLAPDPPQNGIAFCDGSFKSAGGEFTFGNPIPPPQIFPGVELKAINFATQLDPTLIRGGVRITASDITEVEGALLAVFASPARPYVLTKGDAVGGLQPLGALAGRKLQSTAFAAGGTFGFSLPFIGRVDFGNGYWLYAYPDYIAFGGSVLIPVPGIVLTAGIDGEIAVRSGQFSTHGKARACVAGGITDLGCVGGEAWVTSKGFVVCGDIAGELHPGVGYKWGDTLPEIWPFDGCKPSGYWLDAPLAPARAAADGPRTFTVRRGASSVRVRVLGDGGAPDVTLQAPDGETVATDADAFAHSAHLAAFRHTATGATWLAVSGARPGTYTITPRDGSPAIRSVATSEPATLPRITATVRGRGARRTLAYRIGSTQQGQRVTFFERGTTTARRLGTVAKRAGVLRFASDDVTPGARRITALVEAGGFRLGEPTVARYRSAPPRLRRPGRVRVARRKGAVTIRWSAVPGAVRYGVVISPARGAQRILRVPRGRRTLRLAKAVAGPGGTVRVAALDARGRPGAARAARWRPTVRRPDRFLAFRELRRRR